MIRVAVVLGIIGLALATGLFVWQGVGPVLAAFAAAGIGILWASLAHFVPMTLNARGWQVALPPFRRPSLLVFLWAVWLRESVNGLLPVARVGGEVATAQLLIGCGVRRAPAVACIVVDVTISLVTQSLFTLMGVAVLALRGEGASIIGSLVAGLAVALPLLTGFAFAQRYGVFGLFARVFRALFGDRFDRLVGGAVPLDRAVSRLYRRRKGVISCALWQLAGWVAGSVEIWVALRYLGAPAAPGDALVIEALIQAISSGAFVVPGAIGLQEGGFLVIGQVLGLAPEVALALALVRRARDIILFAPALLVWQLALSRRLMVKI